MKYAIWIGLALLLILHQDFWLWDDGSLMFGFLPVGMAYQMGISLAAAVLWWVATRFCWPDVAEEVDSSSAQSTEDGRA